MISKLNYNQILLQEKSLFFNEDEIINNEIDNIFNLLENFEKTNINFYNENLNLFENEKLKKDYEIIKSFKEKKEKKFFNSKYFNLIKENDSVKKSLNLTNKIKKEKKTNKISEFINKIKIYLIELKEEWKNFFISIKNKEIDKKKLMLAAFLFLINLIINTITLNILFYFTGIFGYVITIALLGPLFEETCKRLSVIYKIDKEFFIIFNLYEFSSYVISFMNIQPTIKNFITIVIARGLAVTNHLIWTTYHQIGEKYYNDLENNKHKKLVRIISFLIPLFLHILNNSIAVAVQLSQL